MPVRAPWYSYAVPGDHNSRCDRCGGKAKFSELIFDSYYGLLVHPRHFDGMHPQDRIEAKEDDFQVPWSQPEPPDRFDATAVLKEGDNKATSPVYDVGIESYNVAAVAVKTGAFDDQDDSYDDHPDATAGSGVVLVKPSGT